MRLRKLALLTTALCAVPALMLALTAAHHAASAVAGLRSFVQNPFGLTSRVSPSGPVVLEQVQALRRLETSRYNGQVVVRGDTGGILPRWLAGDRILFLGHGEVVAGVDLQRLRPEDIRVQDGTVALRLPPAQVLHTRLDTARSEVWDRSTGLFTGPDRTLETRVRLEAESRIRQAALEQGLLRTADQHARETLRQYLQPFGVREVRFL